MNSTLIHYELQTAQFKFPGTFLTVNPFPFPYYKHYVCPIAKCVKLPVYFSTFNITFDWIRDKSPKFGYPFKACTNTIRQKQNGIYYSFIYLRPQSFFSNKRLSRFSTKAFTKLRKYKGYSKLCKGITLDSSKMLKACVRKSRLGDSKCVGA